MNEYERVLIQQDEAAIDRILSQFIQNDERARLPEHLFVRHFLPFFSGQVDYTKSDVLHRWGAIAGSPTAPVDIIDAAGRVLYSTPPLFDTSTIDIKRHMNDISIKQIQDGHDMRQANMPSSAVAFYDSHIMDIAAQVEIAEPAPESLNAWQTIFARYGIAVPEDPTAIVVTEAVPESDASLDIEYG